MNADRENFSMSDSSSVQWSYFFLVPLIMCSIFYSDLDLVVETLVTIAVGGLHLAIYLSAKYPNAGTKSLKYMFRDLRKERQERIDKHKSKTNKSKTNKSKTK